MHMDCINDGWIARSDASVMQPMFISNQPPPGTRGICITGRRRR